MSALQRVTPRRAQRLRKCDTIGCGTRWINPGDIYLEHVRGPDEGGDVGNVRFWRLRECATCAEAFGRGHLIKGYRREPVTGRA